MSKIKARKIVKKYAQKLKQEKFPFSAIYLFGSCVSGKPSKWSDIDVAVVSQKLRQNIDKNRFLLWCFRRDVDLRIEPHGFSPEDFQDVCNPMAFEIKKTGIQII